MIRYLGGGSTVAEGRNGQDGAAEGNDRLLIWRIEGRKDSHCHAGLDKGLEDSKQRLSGTIRKDNVTRLSLEQKTRTMKRKRRREGGGGGKRKDFELRVVEVDQTGTSAPRLQSSCSGHISKHKSQIKGIKWCRRRKVEARGWGTCQRQPAPCESARARPKRHRPLDSKTTSSEPSYDTLISKFLQRVGKGRAKQSEKSINGSGPQSCDGGGGPSCWQSPSRQCRGEG